MISTKSNRNQQTDQPQSRSALRDPDWRYFSLSGQCAPAALAKYRPDYKARIELEKWGLLRGIELWSYPLFPIHLRCDQEMFYKSA